MKIGEAKDKEPWIKQLQVAIDNAKRKYDVDLTKEIKYLKKSLNIDENGLPNFWQITKKDKRKARNDEERHKRDKHNREQIKKKLNSNLKCPMNYIYDICFKQSQCKEPIKPISDYFIKHELKEQRRKSKKVEQLIEKYSLELYKTKFENEEDDNYLLLRNDFEKLISDIRATYISKNYLGLMSWLIDRAFIATPSLKQNKDNVISNLSKNKPLLLKVLYDVNKDAFLACFK